jgi:hypothetical protein
MSIRMFRVKYCAEKYNLVSDTVAARRAARSTSEALNARGDEQMKEVRGIARVEFLPGNLEEWERSTVDPTSSRLAGLPSRE